MAVCAVEQGLQGRDVVQRNNAALRTLVTSVRRWRARRQENTGRDGRYQDRQPLPARSTQGQSTQGQSTQGQSSQGQSSQGQSSQGQSHPVSLQSSSAWHDPGVPANKF